MIKAVCLILLALALVGCSSAKHYSMQGVVVSVDTNAKSATIAAGKIGDWMDAMTMDYPIKPDAELAKIHPGDHIDATVVVEGNNYYVTSIQVVGK